MAGILGNRETVRAPTRLVMGSLLFGAVTAAALADDLQGQAPAIRSSFDMRVDVPPMPVTVEGRVRLVYELHLTNFTRVPLTVRRLEVVDADDGTVIGDLRESDLAYRLGGPAATPDGGTGAGSIDSGVHRVVYLELPVDAEGPPRTLEHRVTYHVTGEEAETMDIVQGASVLVDVDAEPRAPLGPPLRGGPWVAIYHPCWERGHRRVFYAIDGRARIPGRFAIDWMKVDDDGRAASGDRDQAANWYGHGAEVLAVADAVVAATRTHLTESSTLSGRERPPLEEGEGNFIVLDIGDGRYALYGHLEPGSVRVRPGDRVRRGDVIAAVGFTGSAGGPQLHFHVADGISTLHSESLAFEIDGFDLLGAYGSGAGDAGCADAADALETLGDAPWTPRDATTDARRTRELPAPNAVIDFGTAGSR